MNHWRAILALIIVGPAIAADAPALVARVIDTQSSRVPAQTVAPEYPRKARRDRIEGEVQICFNVNRDGRPRRVSVRSSTHRAFERPSVKAVRASTFRPLSDDETVPPLKSCRTFVFSLEPVKPGAD